MEHECLEEANPQRKLAFEAVGTNRSTAWVPEMSTDMAKHTDEHLKAQEHVNAYIQTLLSNTASTYMDTHKHVHIHTNSHSCIHKHKGTCIGTHRRMLHRHANLIHTQVPTNGTDVFVCVHTCTCVHVHSHTHTL